MAPVYSSTFKFGKECGGARIPLNRLSGYLRLIRRIIYICVMLPLISNARDKLFLLSRRISDDHGGKSACYDCEVSVHAPIHLAQTMPPGGAHLEQASQLHGEVGVVNIVLAQTVQLRMSGNGKGRVGLELIIAPIEFQPNSIRGCLDGQSTTPSLCVQAWMGRVQTDNPPPFPLHPGYLPIRQYVLHRLAAGQKSIYTIDQRIPRSAGSLPL